MQTVVFHGVGDIRLENFQDPQLKEPGDAIVRLAASAICGADLRFVRGTKPALWPLLASPPHGSDFSDWPGDEPESNHSHGQLQPSPLFTLSGGPGANQPP